MAVRPLFKLRGSGLVIALILLLASFNSFATHEVQTHHIGVLAIHGDQQAKRRWGATAEYLTEKIQGYRFIIVPLSLPEMREALEKRQIESVMTNPGQYVELSHVVNLKPVATLQSRWFNQAIDEFGAVIFTRSDNANINDLNDLSGKSFATVSTRAFGGFQMAQRELNKVNIDPFKDFYSITTTGFPQDDVVYKVLSGEVDAGTVRTGVLERLNESGEIDLNEIKILNPLMGEEYPLLKSTQLYPEWPFSLRADLSTDLYLLMKNALLEMQADHPAALAGRYIGWKETADYRAVSDLFEAIKFDVKLKNQTNKNHDYWVFIIPLGTGLLFFLMLPLAGKLSTNLTKSLILPFAISLLVIAGALSVWVVQRYQEAFISDQVLLANHATRGIAHNISFYVEQQQNIAMNLSDHQRPLLNALMENPEDKQASAKLILEMRDHLPGSFALGIADKNGQLVYNIGTRKIGKKCRSNLALYAQGNKFLPEMIISHSVNSGAPHFDTIASFNGEHSDGILFVSFDLTSLIDILSYTSIPNQTMLLVSKSNPRQIEISHTAVGESHEYGHTLDAEAMKRVLHEAPVIGTDWKMVAIADANYFMVHKSQAIYTIAAAYSTLALIILIFVWRLLGENIYSRSLKHQASHDSLTGLVNRREFDLRLKQAIDSAGHYGHISTLCYMDLDYFKAVNDAVGHHAGDELLRQITRLMQDELRGRDTLARLGGDEFGLLLEHCTEDEAVLVTQKIIDAINEYRFSWQENIFKVGISIGITAITVDAKDAGELLRQADQACYKAKRLGRSRICVYDLSTYTNDLHLV